MSRLRRWLRRTPLYPVLRAGWHLVRPRSRAERDERQTAAILARLLARGGNCVDVGAHRGDVLRQFLRLAPTGTHFALEPIPELAEGLRAEFPGVAVFAAAAGESPGEAEFSWVVSAPAFSGLKRRTDLGTGEEVRVIRVPVVRVDDLVPAGLPVAVVKVDVEGGELGALRGMSRILAECRPWVLLEHGGASAAYGATSADVFGELARHGLAVWLLGDWFAGRPSLSAEEFARAAAGGEFWNFLCGPG